MDAEEEEDPLLIKFPVTKAEDEVRCVYLSSFPSFMGFLLRVSGLVPL
jgi:hypothetical protein